MTRMTKALLMVLLMTSAACTRPDRFGGDDGSIAGPGTTAGATNQVVPGSADDPNSPLYFSQRVGDRGTEQRVESVVAANRLAAEVEVEQW